MAIDFPSSPTEGQIHNVSPGKSFIYRSGVWTSAPMNTALPKNYIVNSAMQISQQNGRISSTTTGTFIADQWQTYWPPPSDATVKPNTQSQIGPAPLVASLLFSWIVGPE
jgi:hypothetical protein